MTKKRLSEIFRGIVARNLDGQRLTGLEAQLVGVYFENHPGYLQKRGCGVSHFIVETDTRWGNTRHFTVVRLDGSKTDFSWKNCIDGKWPSLRCDILFALREAVASQTMAFKGKAFNGKPLIPCALSGTSVSIDGCHVDHCPPDTLENLVVRWLQVQNLSYSDVKLEPSADGYSKQMADPLQLDAWQLFHRENAKLRILSVPIHLSQSKAKPTSIL